MFSRNAEGVRGQDAVATHAILSTHAFGVAAKHVRYFDDSTAMLPSSLM